MIGESLDTRGKKQEPRRKNHERSDTADTLYKVLGQPDNLIPTKTEVNWVFHFDTNDKEKLLTLTIQRKVSK